MDTLIVKARSGSLTEEIIGIAEAEGLDPNIVRDRVADGRLVIVRNVRRYGAVRFLGVGEGLSTKVNVNLGTSTTVVNIDMEVEKCRVAVKYGADTIMDLSVGGDLGSIRRSLIKESQPLPFGTVPTYQAYLESVQKFKSLPTEDYFLKIVEEHLRDGVDFMTIHASVTKELARKVVASSRVEPIVSRGGALITAWILENDSENPYLKNWDYLLELFAEYDATISLGDALRPGSVADALDELQVSELVANARLVEGARSKGVQVMVEGPGHQPLDKVAGDVRLMKSLTKGAPYYVLGPLVTDIAMGYDHIASAIGAAIAAAEGADLICYLTPAEHLSLPNSEQVKEGLIAAKIAAHAGDIVKLGSKVLNNDVEVSTYRAKLMWDKLLERALDIDRARQIHTQFGVKTQSCSMCGSLCVFLILSKYLNNR